MKRFALFVSLAVGVAAAWEISRLLSAENSDAGNLDAMLSGENSQGEPLTLDPAPDESPVAGFIDAVTAPIKDTAVTLSRAVFGTPYDDLIASAATQYGIPPAVLYKLLYTESHFRPDIIDGRTKSPTGALGIAQFMPATAVEELGSVAAALDPIQAIPGAARYLAKLRTSLGGDLTKAVAAYNWGIGNVKRKGLAAAPTETVNYAFNILGVKINA